MQIRDDVIQNTLIPQLNQLADSLTNTQVLSPQTGIDPALNRVTNNSGGTGSFVISVLTPKGQTLTFNPSIVAAGATAPATVQQVINSINGSVVSPYVHASMNASGQMQIDTIQTGTLVKVDQADAVASKLYGFSQSVSDGFNAVHVQGFGLDTPPQWTGGVTGLTLTTPIATGDALTVTGPDGVPGHGHATTPTRRSGDYRHIRLQHHGRRWSRCRGHHRSALFTAKLGAHRTQLSRRWWHHHRLRD